MTELAGDFADIILWFVGIALAVGALIGAGIYGLIRWRRSK